MRVLIACEFSGVVREAMRARGHDAWSCDLLPAEDGSRYHFADDVLAIFRARRIRPWDMILAFPPCTDLAVSGARWFKVKGPEVQQAAADFFMAMVKAPAPRVAVENPIGVMSSRYRKPDQIIQPWQFGHGEVKATCLWLKNLRNLEPTNVVSGRHARVHRAPPGPDRWKERSRTLPGIADAMADQWGRV